MRDHLRVWFLILSVFVCCWLSVSIMAQEEEDENGEAQSSEPELTPEASPESRGPMLLKVWLPEPLVSSANSEAMAVLQAQAEEFLGSQTNVEISFRIKAVGQVGGILSTIAAGSAVAPGALPDLTLVRRQSLLLAQRQGLIRDLEGRVPSAILGDLNSALALGQIENELFGLPYALEVQHLVHRPTSGVQYDSWRFADVLERGEPFVFPSGRPNALSDVFMLQYLDAGGELSRNGEGIVDADALQSTLEFYEQASLAGIVDEEALMYADFADYVSSFINGDINAGVFTSTMYLQMLRDESGLRAAPIPTQSGELRTIMDGWMWTLVTPDPGRQQVAMEFVEWLMANEQQVEFVGAVSMLPSRQFALQQGLDLDASSRELFMGLLSNAILPPGQSEGGTLIRSIRDALQAVITQDTTAEAATRAIIRELEG